jgi:hypothetical protein
MALFHCLDPLGNHAYTQLVRHHNDGFAQRQIVKKLILIKSFSCLRDEDREPIADAYFPGK